MKIKSLMIACAALVFGLTSCNKDNGGSFDPNGESDLYIQFAGGSRADVPGVTNTTVKFTEGALYFTDDAGAVKRYVRITTNSQAGAVTVAALEAGTVIKSVSNSATKIHVYGNVTGEYSNVNLIPAVNIVDQSGSDFGIEDISLYGNGVIEQISGTTNDGISYNRKAHAEVRPIAARLEVNKLSASIIGTVKKFTLAGIYINNYYFEMLPNGELSSGSNAVLVNRLQAYQKYYKQSLGAYPDGQNRPNAFAGEYNDAWDKVLYDYKDAPAYLGDAVNGAIEPEFGAWAYNIFAHSSVTPHIVFHFLDLEVTDPNNSSNTIKIPNSTTGVAGEAYLTVTGYLSTQNGLSGLVNVEGGRIYRLANIIFDEGDLGETPEPEENELDVLVTIEIMDWEIVPVDPSFD